MVFSDVMRYRQEEKERAEFERCVQIASNPSFESFSKIKVQMLQIIGSEVRDKDESKNFNESKWNKEISWECCEICI